MISQRRYHDLHQAEPEDVAPQSATSRDGLSSSPMMNNSSTTPSSAKCRISSPSVMIRSSGPMTMPAAR
jgi:hypothetical protein